MTRSGISSQSVQRRLRKRFLVITDGTVTEAGYFERIRELSADEIKIVGRCSNDIDVMVDRAISMGSTGDYDIISIVCDIDDRLESSRSRRTLEDAVRRAESNGIIVCLSHESFEVWLLAHVGHVSTLASSRQEAKRLAKAAGLLKGRNYKVIVKEKITRESVKCALEESGRLRKVNGCDILEGAPTTDVDLLMKEIGLSD